jgi:cytidylate kinase
VSVIAIDGPSGAGKSTIARALARRLGWRYLDTGAMYRAIALAALRAGVDPADGAALARLAMSARVIPIDRVLLDGEDVSTRIREDDVTRAVSGVSAHPEVRAALVKRQRELAGDHNVVMEGRDIGTVVAPDALVKVFLTASLSERARRRCEQLELDCDEDALRRMEESIAARDDADSTRSQSPLRRAPGAIEVDSTHKSVGAVVEDIAAAVEASHVGR